MVWHIPSGYTKPIYNRLLECNHLLIAGCTGSGKSVVISGILREILQTSSPVSKKIIILDPKRVDFMEYKDEPHVIKYSNEYFDMVKTLDNTISLMNRRYEDMEKRGIKKYDGTDVYLIIDEYADLRDLGGKDVETKVIRLCQLARAAKIHIIIATQRAVSCVSTRIRANIDCRLALHTINKKESINIIDIPGAEKLPLCGKGILQTPSETSYVNIPMTYQHETDTLVNYWKSPYSKTY